MLQFCGLHFYRNLHMKSWPLWTSTSSNLYVLVYYVWQISDKKHTRFHPEMVKIMKIDLKSDKVMTSVTLTFDLETPKTIQHLFGVICTSVQGLVDI